MQKIPFVSLNSPLKHDLNRAILSEIGQLVESSQFILGEKVAQFEAAFAREAGCKYAVGVNSGLDALILSLRALGIGPGDEVITAPNSFVASAAAIALVGAKPVFVDVTDDFNLDVDKCQAAISSRTKAIMPVHLTGYPCNMAKLNALAEHYNIAIVEDAAQAIGASYYGKRVGGFGVAGCFSLHPLKNLHVWGDGGVVTTNDEKFAAALRQHRNHGLKDRDHTDFFSYNSRLDTIQAIVGLAYLELLPEITRLRRENAAYYREHLSGLEEMIRLPVGAPGAESVYHVFQLRVTRRDQLRNFLDFKGIETKIHYPVPIHLQEASKYLGYGQGSFPVTERLAGEILSIPVREGLSKEERERVVGAIGEFCQLFGDGLR